ncbi:MAG: NADH-quinone oxidoreductase subunit J [Thermodesulfovibrionia bacterium]
MTIPQLLFTYLALAITILSLVVITRRNPVHAVLWMLVLFIHLAVLYLTLDAEFLAAIQMIIYAGAILVLFLFVIMLLDVKEAVAEKRFISRWPIALVIGIGLMLFFILVLKETSIYPQLGPYSIERIQSEGNIMVIGRVLYTDYLLPFEIASVVLLVAIIGAVVLAKRRID